jgi:putative PIN family toxin of toxin-antitoxin system
MGFASAERIWVLDTNVVVSGMLSPSAPPGRLLDMVLLRQLTLAVDDRILSEYREVLERPKFAIAAGRLQAFFGIMAFERNVVAPPVAGLAALEEADTMFLEVAAVSGQVLVTGNLRHFPENTRRTVEVLSPTEAWQRLQA